MSAISLLSRLPQQFLAGQTGFVWQNNFGYTEAMTRKASVVIEKDDFGFYAWCPELRGCQSEGSTLEEAIGNIKEAIELYLETLSSEQRDVLLSREILTTAVEVNA